MNKNSKFVLALFWTVVLFQITALKYTLQIEKLATISNQLFFIVVFLLMPKHVFGSKFTTGARVFYFFPGILLVFGLSFNIFSNILFDFSAYRYIANILPWVVYLLIPHFVNYRLINVNDLWEFFYKFMVITSIISFIEYLYVFQIGLGYLKVRELQYGNFLLGFFTVFFPLEDGTPHFRFYGCFIEPGTYAMYLLPAIIYSFLFKKIIGSVILIVALFFTSSLGGLVGLVMIGGLMFFTVTKSNTKNKLFIFLVFILLVSITYVVFGDYFINEYQDKNLSREVREDNVSIFLKKFPSLLINHPFGINLNSNTDIMERNENFVGTNFTLANQFQYGGVFSLIGYLFILLSTLLLSLINIGRANIDSISKVVFISTIVLIPFIFQRMVIMDNCLYAFLFCPTFYVFFRDIEFTKAKV